MIRYRKILLPTDFSDVAKEALDYAYELASLHDAALDVIHVFEEPTFPSFYGAGALMLYGKVPDIRKEAEAALNTLVAPLRERGMLDVNTLILDGHAAESICGYAKENEIDLIVIPTYGLTGLKHIFLGSVAERVVREAHCPVFVFKAPITPVQETDEDRSKSTKTGKPNETNENTTPDRSFSERSNRIPYSSTIRQAL